MRNCYLREIKKQNITLEIAFIFSNDAKCLLRIFSFFKSSYQNNLIENQQHQPQKQLRISSIIIWTGIALPSLINFFIWPKINFKLGNLIRAYNQNLMKLILTVLSTLLLFSLTNGSQIMNCNSPAYWTGRRCTCPMNMVMVNGKCACDYGYLRVNSECKRCDSNGNFDGKSCAGTSDSCQEFYKWNGASCEINWAANNCQKDEYWNGAQCMKLSYPAICLASYVWINQACVLKFESRCDDGNYYNGKNCVGFVNPPRCESGFAWNSQVRSCLTQNFNRNCETGKYWNGRECVSEGQTCVVGNYWNGKDCYSTLNPSPICLSDTLWSGYRCKPKVNNAVACDNGFSFNPRSNACQLFLCENGLIYNSIEAKCPNVLDLVGNIPQTPIPGIIGSLGSASSLQGGIAIAGQGSNASASPNSFALSMSGLDWKKGLGLQTETYNSINTDQILQLLSGAGISVNNFNTIVPRKDSN